jgi:hypothetical protein
MTVNTPPLRGLRGWLARQGILSQGRVYSRSIWGMRKSDVGWKSGVKRMESSHGQSPGCDAWPIHVVLRELDQGRGFGFAHFNDGECRCLIEGAHTNRDGVEICPEHVRRLLEDCIVRLTTSVDPKIRERFLVGLPCPRCHGVQAEDVLREFPELEHHHRLPATLFHHAMRWLRPRLADALVKRGGDAFLVCSTKHDVDAIERLLGIPFRSEHTKARRCSILGSTRSDGGRAQTRAPPLRGPCCSCAASWVALGPYRRSSPIRTVLRSAWEASSTTWAWGAY